MKMNTSYDEDNEEDRIIISNSNNSNINNKCYHYYFSFECTMKFLYVLLILFIFELLLYYILNEYNEINNDITYEYINNTNRRGLISFYKHKCENHNYGCCNIYTGEYNINTESSTNIKKYEFTGMNYLYKKDKYGSNCPNLISIISNHNELYDNNENNCLKQSDKNKCCKFDIMTDQIQRDNKQKNNTSYINHFLKTRYIYLIDYNNGNCPSIQELMIEYRDHSYCNSRYYDCRKMDMIIMNIIFGCCLICLFVLYIKIKCSENKYHDISKTSRVVHIDSV